MKTVKLSIIANASRVIELLELDNVNHQAELIAKMHELRRDTTRLEGLLKGLFRSCNECQKEFKATNSYEYQCPTCRWDEYQNHVRQIEGG